MNKCLRVTLSLKSYDEDLISYIQRSAKKFKIEGTLQALDKKTVRIIACGKADDVDMFMDDVYKGHKTSVPASVEVEPFLKDRDHRGVFRIIE